MNGKNNAPKKINLDHPAHNWLSALAPASDQGHDGRHKHHPRQAQKETTHKIGEIPEKGKAFIQRRQGV